MSDLVGVGSVHGMDKMDQRIRKIIINRIKKWLKSPKTNYLVTHCPFYPLQDNKLWPCNFCKVEFNIPNNECPCLIYGKEKTIIMARKILKKMIASQRGIPLPTESSGSRAG